MRDIHRAFASPVAVVGPDPSRLGVDEMAFLKTLDAVTGPLAFYDLAGQRRYVNRAFMERLTTAAEPDVHAAIDQTVIQFSANIEATGGTAPGRVERIGCTVVETSRGELKVQVSYVGVDLFGGGPSVMACLEPVGVELPTEADLRSRFQLTSQEARVALLLARGISNKCIAGKLGISPYTARHHTARVLRKLGVTTRAAVTAQVVGGG